MAGGGDLSRIRQRSTSTMTVPTEPNGSRAIAAPECSSTKPSELLDHEETKALAEHLIDLAVGKDRVLAMPREVQRDHLAGRFIHVDFLRIARDEKIAVEVPIHVVGDSHGVKEGGVVEHHLWTLHVECFPQDVPSAIEADISALGINESLHVSDLVVPASLTILTALEETVVSVVTPQILKVEEVAPAEEVAEEGAAEEGAEEAPAKESGEAEG